MIEEKELQNPAARVKAGAAGFFCLLVPMTQQKRIDDKGGGRRLFFDGDILAIVIH
ncbi:hypothetical protein [Stomatobaculum longum]|uniref:hypothetical protein n=1 Tax=Stomatobaculum longum TaxID=796942 RepID=UPI003C75002F